MLNYKLKTKEELVMETSEGKTKKKFLKSEKVKKNYYSGIWSIFVHADTMDKWLTLIGIVSCFGDGISMPLMVLVTGKIINNLGGASSMSVSEDFIDGINKKSLIMVYLAMAKLLLGFLVGFCWTRTGERQASKMRLHYLKSILRQDIEYFDLKEVSTSDVITSVSSDTLVVQDALSEKIPTFITSCSTFIGCIMVGFFEVWRLAVMTLPTMILLVLPSLVYGRMMISLARKNRVEYNKAGVVAEQAISSIRTVYSCVGEKRTILKFSKALMGPLKLGLKQGLLKGIAIGSNSFVFAIWAFVSWYGSRLVMYHGVKGGNVYVVGVTVIVGGLSLGSGLSTIKYISEAASAGQRVMEVMSRTPKIDTNSTEGETLKSISGDIEFDEVQFAYPSRPDSPILRSFTLNVPSKKTVALVGSSGSGKSTVIALLERFYDPSSGSILLDGVDIKRLNLKWMRSQIGLVSQEPVLFAMSIKDNLMFGKDNASMEEVVAAAKAANAHGFIAELPSGYDTQIGEGGIQMSGGQKQRLAIARAIIRSPKILLLDEATSALDTDSERIVQNALDRASVDRTTIVVAHRLSTIRNADTIAVVQSGRVVESGSHDSLLSMDSGVYASLVRLQQIETVQDESALESSRNFLLATSSSTRLLDAPRASKVDPNLIEQPPSKTLAPTFRRLLSLSVPEWKHALIGCLNALVFGVIQPMYAYNNGAMISVYFLQDHSEIKRKTRIYSLIFTAVSILSFLTAIGQHYNLGAMGEHLTKRVREQVLMKMLTFEVGWFDRDENSTGAICSRLANDANLVRSLVGDRIALLIQTMSSVLLAFTLSLIISWRLSVIMIAIQPLIIVCFYARRVLLKSMSSKGMKAQSESSKMAAEAVSNLRTVTAFSSQEWILRVFESAQDGPRRENVRQSWIAGVVLGFSQALVACSWALNFWYGGKLVSKGYITPKAIFQTFTILITTGRTIADAGSMTTDLASGASAIASLFSILDSTTSIDPEDPNGYVPDKLHGRIEFCNVDFAYPARPSVVIFRGLSLIIDARKSTALVGQSGSGKSTVIGLIERFYDPLSGVVTIDGRDVKSYHLRLLREQIALVGQEPTLFSGNIRENIMYGMENATETEMEDAARAANAHEFITGLKEGYNTFCGDRGIQLSGGQKQRIAIARAVLRNPTILLLDEATSALDGPSEKVVQDALERMMIGRTSVVVAHRLSTVRNCNEIVALEKGVVVEKGSHDSLMRKGSRGVYYGMAKLQQVHSTENYVVSGS